MKTAGDKNLTTALHDFGAKSLWTYELEALLLDGRLDLIVHSLKDIPTQIPPSLTIGANRQRGRYLRRDIFERMYNQIQPPVKQQRFELVCPQALGAKVVQGRRQVLVARRLHGVDLVRDIGPSRLQRSLHDIRLDQGERGLSGPYADDVGGGGVGGGGGGGCLVGWWL